MSTNNCSRSGCKDVFHAYLVENAQYAGDWEFPCINPEESLPVRLIPFSKTKHSKDNEAWVHFYEDDANFECFWNRPSAYLARLRRFAGVITPDFSLYRDMPLVMQNWNIYRSRALGTWLQEKSIPVIPNVRWGDERTFSSSCAGISEHTTIAVGSHGCMKCALDRHFFVRGLEYAIAALKPKVIIVYGTAPKAIFEKYRDAGITILQFDSEFALSRKAVSA